MTDRSLEIFCLLLAAVVLLYSGKGQPHVSPSTPAVPVPPVKPAGPDDSRRKPWLPWRGDEFANTFGASVGGLVTPDGTPAQCPLPGELHRRNTASRGLGNCVFTSLHHSGLWQNVPQVVEMPAWLIKNNVPGGGYPDKVDQLIDRISKDRGMPVPEYIQVQGRDLEVLKKACKSRRMPGITYGRSPTGRYNGQHIDHMVSLVHADDRWFGILDNNYPGKAGDENVIEWQTPAEFLRCYTDGSSGGWSVIFISPSPTPLPRNAAPPSPSPK